VNGFVIFKIPFYRNILGHRNEMTDEPLGGFVVTQNDYLFIQSSGIDEIFGPPDEQGAASDQRGAETAEAGDDEQPGETVPGDE